MTKRLLFACAMLIPALLSAQILNFDLALPNFSNNFDSKIASVDLAIKAPLINNSNVRVLVGFSGVYTDAADKLGNPYIGFKYSGLPLNFSTSGKLFIPSAENNNPSALSAFIALQDTRLGSYAPEATPVEIGFDSWANLPYNLHGDFHVGGLALFQGDKKVLSDDSFEFVLPFVARVSRNHESIEAGIAWSGLWYATENIGDRVLSQLRFDGGVWLGPFKPTVEIALPMSGDLQDVLDNTITLKLVVR